ncbi:MAG: 30S ribosome-binding factor RbfA, partial [Actinomycetota bacterium]
LASEVERLKDPGVGFVTITEVTITPDLRNAKAFYTVYGSDVERAATRDGLRRATKHLRSAVAAEIRMRFTPTLEFVEDPLPASATRIDTIIASLNRDDERDDA